MVSDGGGKLPPLPGEMVRRSRRTRTVRVRKGESAWQWSRMKTLLFTEDVRPAYHGTFTRPNLPALAADDEAAPDAFAAALADASGWLPDAPKRTRRPRRRRRTTPSRASASAMVRGGAPSGRTLDVRLQRRLGGGVGAGGGGRGPDV